MRTHHKFLKNYLYIITCSIFLTAPALALDDAIVAIVDKEVITLKELKDYIHSYYVQLTAEGKSDMEIRDIMIDLQTNGINKLIEDKLILNQANKIGIEINEKLIDDRLKAIKERYPSEKVFLDALVAHGGTITDLRNKILTQFKIKFTIDHEVKSKIFVNPKEVTEYYEKNIDKFRKKERTHVDSIFISFAKAGQDKALARQKASDALKLLQEGRDFKEVAQQYSETPSLGTLERGTIIPAIEDQVFSLSKGETSPLVEVEAGIYIFKVNGKTLPSIAPLKDVKETVYELVYQEKFRKRFFEWLDKLKKRAFIEIKE